MHYSDDPLFLPDSKLVSPNLQHALGFRERLRNEISSDDVKAVQKRLLAIDYDKYLAEVEKRDLGSYRRSVMAHPPGIPKFGAKRVHINIHENPYYADAHFTSDRIPFELVIGQPGIKIPEPNGEVYYLPLYDGAYIQCEGMKVKEDWDINKYK